MVEFYYWLPRADRVKLSQAIECNGVIARRVPVVELVDAVDGDVEKQSLKHARDGAAWEDT